VVPHGSASEVAVEKASTAGQGRPDRQSSELRHASEGHVHVTNSVAANDSEFETVKASSANSSGNVMRRRGEPPVRAPRPPPKKKTVVMASSVVMNMGEGEEQATSEQPGRIDLAFEMQEMPTKKIHWTKQNTNGSQAGAGAVPTKHAMDDGAVNALKSAMGDLDDLKDYDQELDDALLGLGLEDKV
jgi:hypothetical protein